MQKDMQLHINKARKLIGDYLPSEYVDRVLAKLPENVTVSKGTVRNVKNNLSNRLDVLNAMVEVALDNKKQQEKLKKLTT